MPTVPRCLRTAAFNPFPPSSRGAWPLWPLVTPGAAAAAVSADKRGVGAGGMSPGALGLHQAARRQRGTLVHGAQPSPASRTSPCSLLLSSESSGVNYSCCERHSISELDRLLVPGRQPCPLPRAPEWGTSCPILSPALCLPPHKRCPALEGQVLPFLCEDRSSFFQC